MLVCCSCSGLGWFWVVGGLVLVVLGLSIALCFGCRF